MLVLITSSVSDKPQAPTANPSITSMQAVSNTLPPPSNISVSITPPGTVAAGQNYDLVCSVVVTGFTGQPTITWQDADGVPLTFSNKLTVSMTVNISDDSYSSTLTFTPLSVSDAGMYMCVANTLELTQLQSVSVTSVRGK